jgi:hypothetical protein
MSRAGLMSRNASGKAALGKKPAGVTAKSPLSHDAIAKRAYEIWVRKGRPAGQCKQNWKQAEAELRTGG